MDEDWNAGIFVGATEEQKKAALKLLDYVYSEEGMILMNFGEEGTHFNIVDGEYKYSDLIMNNPDGLSPQDALRQFGIQSMLTLLQDAFKKAEGVTPGQYRLSNQTMDSQN